jgi:hypothetical protein
LTDNSLKQQTITVEEGKGSEKAILFPTLGFLLQPRGGGKKKRKDGSKRGDSVMI